MHCPRFGYLSVLAGSSTLQEGDLQIIDRLLYVGTLDVCEVYANDELVGACMP